MDSPEELNELLKQRNELRAAKKYAEADAVRKKIEEKGYIVKDTAQGATLEPTEGQESEKIELEKPGKVAIFGSGEMSPTGRRVHEALIKNIPSPVKISLLETPAGYEDNPHNWYQKLAEMMKVGLQNFKPKLTLIDALRNDGEKSTNNDDLLKPLETADYIHTGAGSPSYALRMLKDSLALKMMVQRHDEGYPLSFASAAAIALSHYALPVYEIYFVGEDPYWNQGINFFARWGMNLTIIPHFNNKEGGEGIDTSHAYMGIKRFEKLMSILPGPTTILGIDEQTSCIFDPKNKKIEVMGNGTATIITKQKTFKAGESFDFSELS